MYHYQSNGTSTTTPGAFTKNQLLHVKDIVSSTVVDYDVDNQINNNYVYDKIGNLIADAEEEIDKIVWRQDGKIHEIIRTNGSQKPNLAFMYDEGGTRIAKIVKPVGTSLWTYTHYVRDVSGNVIATYEQEKLPTDPTTDLRFTEHTLYGSKRVGVIKQNMNITDPNPSNGLITKAWNRKRGNKNYELANHLGNVINGVSDLKIRVGTGSGTTLSHYEADVHFASDYFPFGMQMKERTFAAQDYTYGFNGQEQDDELLGGAVSFKYRIHDPRIGRFLSVDPLAPEYPWNSSYAFAENQVIWAIDLEGAEAYIVTHRSFAPWSRFGDLFTFYPKSFDGDNRGFSLLPSTEETPGIPNETASARIHQIMPIELGERTEKEHRQFSSITRGNNGFMGAEKEKFANSSWRGESWFTGRLAIMKMNGTDPLVMGGVLAPPIKWKLTLDIRETKDGLRIDGRLDGKQFPAYESFITDANGTSVFITTVSAPDRLSLGPELTQPLMEYTERIELLIPTDSDGNFKGTIYQAIREYRYVTIFGLNIPVGVDRTWYEMTIEEWNSHHLNTNPAPDCESNECGNNIE